MSLASVGRGLSSKGSLLRIIIGLSLIASVPVNTQIRHTIGQNVAPIFEGWEGLPDGSFDMVFGYLNRNYEEEVNVPIGLENSFEPGVDRGQPTHFYVRRQQFVFRVRVPKDWGSKELVWTLTAHGQTQQAFGTLATDYELDQEVYRANRGGPPSDGRNQAPAISLVGTVPNVVRALEPMALTVKVTDDGSPPPRPSRRVGRSADSRTGVEPESAGPRRETPIAQSVVKLDPGVRLGVTWVFYRGGPGTITFEPMRTGVVDDKATTRLSFSDPGTYQIRAYADDGILTSPADITVTVN
jgi:hypothetical protein